MSQKIAWPNGLAIDWETKELYWTDAKLNHIQAIGLNGANRRTVVRGNGINVYQRFYGQCFTKVYFSVV